MWVSRALTWLCEEPQGKFILAWVLRRGWTGFANVVLLPKQVERVIFLGVMGGLIYYGRPQLGSLGNFSGLSGHKVLGKRVPAIILRQRASGKIGRPARDKETSSK